MRIFFICILFLSVLSTASGQKPREDFKRDIRLSASNHLAYPEPPQDCLTAAPEGYSPFYMSHYGRHGSRYMINKEDYDMPYNVLKKADSAGVLTTVGKDVIRRMEIIRSEAENRYGELSPLGAVQHRGIANRMFHRFPEIFSGKAVIDAKSTVVIRCILSMEYELLEFMRLNPEIIVKSDASEHDMYYMNLDDDELQSKRMPQRARDMLEEKYKSVINYDYTVCKLFSDTTYAWRNIDLDKFYGRLFRMATTVQNTEARGKVSLFDLFSDEQVYNNWWINNIYWYATYGACPLNGATQPFSQRNLLRKIIEEADSCIALPKPGATLRFGHETMVLPLTCLMGINGYDLITDDLDHLDAKGWIDYKVFAMGSNIQLVFYRKSVDDKDVIVKVLLNEREATLPVKTDIAPYYKWSDVREYYKNKLEAYSSISD